MKVHHSLFISFILMLSFKASAQTGIVVEGKIVDSKENYVMLAYSPYLRGNLNFDGFKSIGSEISEDGKFSLKSKHITHAANYRLFFPKHYVPLTLFEGDRIHLRIHPNDPEQTFAKGKGAGKINILNLDQFQYEYFDLEKERSLEEFVDYIEQRIQEKLELLAAIYSKEVKSSLIAKSSNADLIKKIIKHSPLNQEEYVYLKQLQKFQHYSLISSFLREKSGQEEFQAMPLDFDTKAFRHFTKTAYRQLPHINDWRLITALESILQIEYLREKQAKENLAISMGNWTKLAVGADYISWISKFLRDHFPENIYDKYYAEYTTGLMSWGRDYAPMMKELDLNRENKYVDRVQAYIDLLSEGLEDKAYELNLSAKDLNEEKLQYLLNSYGKSPLISSFLVGSGSRCFYHR